MPIYKDQKRNTWFVQTKAKNNLGASVTIKKRGFSSYRLAKAYEKKALAALTPSVHTTFGILWEKYMEDAQNLLKESSLVNKTYRVKRYILPFWENKVLDEITEEDFEKWYDIELSHRFIRATYKNMIVADLLSLFHYAEKYLHFTSNVLLKINLYQKTKKDIPPIWSLDDFKKASVFLQKSPDYYLAILLMYFSGIRIGELLSLTPKDILYNSQSISVSKTLRLSGAAKKEITSPKTQNAYRQVIIPKMLFNKLEKFIEQNNIKNDAPIFNFIKVSDLREMLKYSTAFLSLPAITPHGLRHSHASLLASLGYTPLLIKERLGHQEIAFTVNTYTHMFDSDARSFSNHLDHLHKSPSQNIECWPAVIDQDQESYRGSFPDFPRIETCEDMDLESVIYLLKSRLFTETQKMIQYHAPLPVPTPIYHIIPMKNRIVIYIALQTILQSTTV